MKTEIILAILAILLARPMEMVWDKIFENKSVVVNYIGKALHITLNYLFPLAGIIYYTFYNNEFNRLTIAIIGLFYSLLTFALITDVTVMLGKRIRMVMDRVKALEQEKEDKDKEKIVAGDYNIYAYKKSDYNGE